MTDPAAGSREVINVAVATHGRVLVERRPAAEARLLVGFHGYAQHADEMLDLLRAIAPSGWTLVSVQGLHRFYRRGGRLTVASWMTREDRELAIQDNLAYVEAVIARVADAGALRGIVYCGFSQGAAMAYRAAVRCRGPVQAVIALGGDVPPELLDDQAVRFPPALIARGIGDALYTEAQMARDAGALASRGAILETMTFEGGHEWTPEFASRAEQFVNQLAAASQPPASS